MRSPFGFPDTVNERAARVVAAGVALSALVVLITGWHLLTAIMAVGFLARVLAGPRWSPLALLATRVVAPRLGPPKLVPGPPKRFAQAIGLGCTAAAAVSALALGAGTAADVLVGVLLVFATLEAAVGFCAGCWAFWLLVRAGLIPASVCAACTDLRLRASS